MILKNPSKVLIVGDEPSFVEEATKKTKGSKKEFLSWFRGVRDAGKPVIFYREFSSHELSSQLPECGTGSGVNKSPQILVMNVCRKHGFNHSECQLMIQMPIAF